MATRNVPDRVRVRRQPKRGRYDRASIDAALDRALVAHVAFVDGDHPVCLPTLFARMEDSLLIHGSSASRMLRRLAAGAEACVTVTTIHALVLARSAFEHSANYDSVIVFGRFRRVEDPAERLAAYEAFTNKLLPGRWDEVRPPSRKELKATQILALPIEQASLKSRSGPPSDDDSPDAEIDTWAGELPLKAGFGEPRPSPGLRPEIPLSGSVRRRLEA